MTGFECDETLQRVCLMARGSTMLKAGRKGKPHFRKFQISNDLQSLHWESPNKDKGETLVPLKNIQEILRGQKTKVFQDNPIPEYEGVSFSVLYKQGNLQRSLDIVCKDRDEFDLWTSGLEALLSGFDDVDGVHNIMKTTNMKDSKFELEVGWTGYFLRVNEDSCDIYSWGASHKGTLGHGEEEEELIPRAVEAVLGKDIKMVACGSEHTMAITENGEAFAWGSGSGGKLGMGNILDRYMPLQIGAFREKIISYIACNEFHSAAITSTGELFTFGRAGPWLGYATTDRKQALPTKVEALSDYEITKVSCGSNFTLALTSGGEVFAFGGNEDGQLGLGHHESETAPAKVCAFGDAKIKEISCGVSHSGAVAENGDVWLWGANEYGQLGTGNTEPRNTPANIACEFADEKIKDIKCGRQHSIALSSSGKIYCFGDGQYGQLGTNQNCALKPILIQLPNRDKVVHIGCGGAHTAAVTENGNLLTWGKGGCGRLGHADHANRFYPTIVGSLVNKRVQSVSCGATHTAACVIRAWIADEEANACMACKLQFTVLRRRHHCRKCGGVFCGACTTHKVPILEIGYIDPVIVCDRCYTVLTESKA